jgi:membrane fusion protein (multidrug efflux system)
MKRRSRILIGLAAIGFLAAGTGCGNSQSTHNSRGGGPPVLPVETAAVRTGPVADTVQAVGTLQANESVVVRSEIPGRIQTIQIREGRRVAAGEVLVTIDPAEYQAQVEQVSAQVKLNRLNFERAQQLHRDNLLSQQEYDAGEAKLSESQAQLALARARLDKTTLRAPFDGVVGLRQVSPGDYLQPGQAIVNLESIDPLKLDFRIPEVHLHRLKPDLEVEVRVDAHPDRLFHGRVYAMDPRVDETSRTVLMRASVPNPAQELRPGMFVRVSLVLGRRPNAVLIPEQAVVPMGGDEFVYRVVDGKAVLTQARIGQRLEGLVEILEGLSADDTVVTGGQMKIFDGAAVKSAGPADKKPEAPAAAKP